MALNKVLEEALALIQDEGDQTALRASFEKYPDLSVRFEGNLRQEDFDRNSGQLKTDREAFETEKTDGREKIAKWQSWFDQNKASHDGMLSKFEGIQAMNTKLEAEVQELKDKGVEIPLDGSVTSLDAVMKAVDERVAARGYVDADGFDKKFAEQSGAVLESERADFLSKTLPGVIAYNTALTTAHFNHRDQFDEPLDTEAFMKYMAENKLENPVTAYDGFVKDKLHAKELTDKEEEIRKDERTKIGLPGTGAPPTGVDSPAIGPVEMLRQGKATDGIPEGAQIGDGQAGAAAAAAMRADGQV